MEKPEIKKLVLDFVKKRKFAVLSTVTPEGLPEAALIEFGETDELELIFETMATYRKYTNLQLNNRVALVIGWEEAITVQYEGIAHELSGEELKKYQQYFYKKNPRAERWEEHPGSRVFKVVPTWIKYGDFGVDPWQIHEINL